MDKETLSNYGWIVILVLILAVMIALATPFGSFIAGAIKSTTAGLFDVNQNALDAAGITIPGQDFQDTETTTEIGALFAEDGSIIKTWDELLADGDVTVDGDKLTKIAFDLEGYKLVVPGTIKSCGGDISANKSNTEAFVYGNTEWEDCGIKVIVFQEGIETIGKYTFSNSHGITVYFPSSVTTFETYAMCSLDGVAHYKGQTYDMDLDGDVWYDNWDIFNELPEAQNNAMYVYK